MSNKLYSQLDSYVSDLLASEDDVLRSVVKSLDTEKMPQNSVFPNQGKLLQILIKLGKVKRILEIGTLGGYSTIWMARALPDDGELISIELDPDYAEVAKKNIKKANLQHKVEVKVGEALSIFKRIDKSAGEFDLFFFDAHKPSYVKYFNWALRHSHKGSLIVADNIIRDGKVLDKESKEEKVIGVQEFNEMLSRNKKVSSTIITNASGNGFDGMSLSYIL